MSYKFSTKITENNIAAFTIGILSTMPYLLPTLLSLRATPEYDLYRLANLENKLLYLPVSFGILHIVLFNIFHKIFTTQMRTYWLLGIIIGIIYASIDYYNDYYTNMYGLKSYISLYIMWQVIFFGFYGIFVNFMFSNIK